MSVFTHCLSRKLQMLETELGIIVDSCHAGMFVNASFCGGKYALSLF